MRHTSSLAIFLFSVFISCGQNQNPTEKSNNNTNRVGGDCELMYAGMPGDG